MRTAIYPRPRRWARPGIALGRRAPWSAIAVALVLAAGVVVGAGAPAAAQRGPAPSFGECETSVDEAALREEVVSSSRAVMRAAALRVDYARIVGTAWTAARFDQRFETIVDAKIAELREDTTYVERLLQGNIPARAREMAERTAELVFRSPEFEALEADFRGEIGRGLAPLVEDAQLEAQSNAARCIQAFLGERYAATVQSAFTEDVEGLSPAEIALDGGSAGAGAALSMAGVVSAMLALVFRRMVQRVIRAAVTRLAGAIAARLAAMATVIGGVLILAYELVAGADGVFPIIRAELLSAQTRVEIQTAVIEELAATGPEQLEARADEVASAIFTRWRAFRDTHRSVLELADDDETFRRFLADQPPRSFEALSIVVRELRAGEPGGDAGVLDAVRRGLLQEAVRLPNAARHVEEWAGRGVDVETLVAWRRRTGASFERALRLELPAIVRPDELSRTELTTLFELDEPSTARKVAGLSPSARADMLAMPRERIERLGRAFERDQLETLLGVLRLVDGAGARARYVDRALERPSLLDAFENASVVSAVEASRSRTAAVDMLLGASDGFTPLTFYTHAQSVADGDVAPMVLAHRYGWGLAIGVGAPLLLGLIVLRWFGRLLGFGSRRRRAA